MNRLTESELTANAQQMSLALIEICARKQIGAGDSSLIIGAACAEAIAHFEGHVGAVETLRLLADMAEREVLRAN